MVFQISPYCMAEKVRFTCFSIPILSALWQTCFTNSDAANEKPTHYQNRTYPQQMDVCRSRELWINDFHLKSTSYQIFRWDILASESRNMRSIMAFVALMECRFQDGKLLFNHEVSWRRYEQRRLRGMFRALIGRLIVMSKISRTINYKVVRITFFMIG